MQEKNPINPEKTSKNLKNYARYSNIAFQILAIILIGVFGGRKLDQWLKTEYPVFTVILSFAAVIVALYSTVKDIIQPKK